ncbi:hypothetical protein QBC39DRAFT_54226 [Podospora conica]|nr:hypothetical protein QBC39DRAFT_54226 [Schizothecium conicum]
MPLRLAARPVPARALLSSSSPRLCAQHRRDPLCASRRPSVLVAGPPLVAGRTATPPIHIQFWSRWQDAKDGVCCRCVHVAPFRTSTGDEDWGRGRGPHPQCHALTRPTQPPGAGPAGLTAAKSLLNDAPPGAFDVTVFEAQPRIGGLWPLRSDDGAGLVHPLMAVNGSRHTIQFSDLAWDDATPEFPKAWQVGRYLDRYYQTYCQAAHLKLDTRVEKAEPLSSPDASTSSASGWRVQTRTAQGAVDEQTFDYLVVASGIFGKPLIPSAVPDAPSIPILHSSKYRDLAGLLGATGGQGGKILIVGGQFSGIEIADTIATHLSSAAHSPGTSPIAHPENYSIHHVVQKKAWVLPLHVSPKPATSAPPFLPMDLSFYNLRNRAQPIANTQGHISEDAARIAHKAYRTIAGTDQSIFSPEIAISDDDTLNPPYLGISEHYTNFVRSGLISVSYGRLDGLQGNVAVISPSQAKIEDIAAVVLATGFDAASSLSYLPSSVQQALSVSPTDNNNPVALAFHNTHHPAVPGLGFVGFYRSPYWGVAEMQARLVTELFLAGGPTSPTLPPHIQDALANDTSIDRTLSLRTDPRMSQFPMGDYVWLMHEFASALGLSISPPQPNMPALPPSNQPTDILTPARFPPKTATAAQKDQAALSLAQVDRSVRAALTSTKYVARAVFRSLLGEWKLERSLTSRLPSHPSGHFSGTARFLLREGTRDGRGDAEGSDPGLEYLYVEEGDFRASNGLTFRATRRYVWRYDEVADRLSVWFVRTDDQKRADYLFHNVEFAEPEGGQEDDGKGWRATAGHMCIEDFYDVGYEFRFEAVELGGWRLAYTVKGPKKDYTIDGSYSR